jgi:p-aminobenzoyl-glutamate transporter AbgT
MVHGIRTISGIIIIVVVISIMNHYGTTMTTIITTMMIIVIVMIDANRHYSKSCKIGGIIGVMIWRIIGHIYS